MMNLLLRWLGKIGVALGSAALMFSLPVPAEALPKPKEISIYYLSSGDENDLGRAATVVKNSDGKKTGLFLVLGDVFKPTSSTALFDGRAEAAMLGEAGVDAVYLTEGLFLLGGQSARTLVDSVKLHFLGINLKDEATDRPFTAGYIIKNFGSLRLALVGIIPDSFPLAKRLKGIAFANPDSALKRIIPLLRFRSDLIGVVGSKTAAVDFSWDLKDLGTLPAHSLGRIRLTAKGKNWQEKREVIRLDTTIVGEPAIRTTLARYGSKTDSLLSMPLPATGFSDSLLKKAVMGSAGVDDVVLKSFLVPGDLRSPRQILEFLVPVGHLAIFEMTGSEMKGINNSKVDPNKTYRIGTTIQQANPEQMFKNKKFELSEKSVARMVLDYYSHEAH